MAARGAGFHRIQPVQGSGSACDDHRVALLQRTGLAHHLRSGLEARENLHVALAVPAGAHRLFDGLTVGHREHFFEACEALGGQSYKGTCYQPVPAPKRRPTSSPTDTAKKG